MLDTDSIAVDQVVLAVPPPAAEALLPGGGTHAPAGWAERLGASPIVNVHVRYDRPVTEHAVLRRRRVPGAVGLRPDRGQRRRQPGNTWPSRCPRPAGRSTSGPPTCVAEIVPGAGRAAAGGPGRDGARLLGHPGAHRDLPAGTGQRRPAPAGRLGGAGDRARRRVDRHRLAGDDGERRALAVTPPPSVLLGASRPSPPGVAAVTAPWPSW